MILMRVGKYLLGLWITAAVYTLFSVLNGPRGLSAYDQLLAERERQWDNLRNLGAVNEDLEKTKNSLLYDKDTLAVYSRQLGYGQENERFIRIVGLGGIKNPHTMAGQVYFAAPPDYISDKVIKITALCAGLAVCILFLIMDLLHRTQ
jgi:cell division protein FtsB